MNYFDRALIEDVALLGNYKKRFNSPLIDRTGVFGDTHKILTEIPEGVSKLSFDECMIKRAEEIVATGKDICVSYSGGIDSTAALIALIMAGANPFVVMTDTSFREYPEFFEHHIGRYVWVDELEVHDILREFDGVVVTGEIGDQLFGSALMAKYTPEQLAAPWYMVVDGYIAHKFAPLVSLCPNEDLSLGNILWWINFTLKYQWVQLRMFATLETKKYEDIFNFYDTTEFQQWSLCNPMSVKYPDYHDPASYKLPAKHFIYEFTGDLWYYKSKLKVPSLCNTVKEGISKDLSRITEDMKIFKMRMEEYEVN